MEVDPKIRDYLPKLKPEEKQALEELLNKEGCRDKLVVWRQKNVLVDGHNRDEIITRLNLKHPGIHYMDFEDYEDVFEYIDALQGARRNLSDMDWKLVVARRYERMKKRSGGQEGNKNNDNYSKLESRGCHDVTLDSSDDTTGPGKTAKALGKELGIGTRTVQRAAVLAKSIDKLESCGIHKDSIPEKTFDKVIIEAAKVVSENPEEAKMILGGRKKGTMKQKPHKTAEKPKIKLPPLPITLGEVFIDDIIRMIKRIPVNDPKFNEVLDRIINFVEQYKKEGGK